MAAAGDAGEETLEDLAAEAGFCWNFGRVFWSAVPLAEDPGAGAAAGQPRPGQRRGHDPGDEQEVLCIASASVLRLKPAEDAAVGACSLRAFMLLRWTWLESRRPGDWSPLAAHRGLLHVQFCLRYPGAQGGGAA